MDEDVNEFMGITGVDDVRVAKGYLEVSGGDTMQAIQLYFENPELASGFTSNPAPAPPADGGPSRGARSARNQPPSGEVNLDSDGDIELSDGPGSDEEADLVAVARNAQEEEDAAMARRLQEEMYGGAAAGGASSGPADDVRAPIAQTTEMLSAPAMDWGADDDRDSAVLEQLRRRQQAARNRRAPGAENPFNQSVWDDPEAPRPAPAAGELTQSVTARRLADLFRPPHEIISHADWEEARYQGRSQRKWILVNLQDMDDFHCQLLNRDYWKNEAILALIKEHFIFLQFDKNSIPAEEYITYYLPNQAHEDHDNYPHVAIIDPRTGEQVKLWYGKPFIKPNNLHEELVEFLDRYSLAANSKNPVVHSKPKEKIDVGKMSEEEMLEMALKNSLQTGSNGESSASGSRFEDPDRLTQQPDGSKYKGKGRAADEAIDLTEEADSTPPASAPAPAESAFARISSTSPHSEPDNNPATTTRIQFRHSAGRVIRRFSTTDPVRRIFEWLKAAPLEGKEGITFELKTVPEGKDLLTELDKTIEEAGLKQATVMIEFIED